jgi:hypothetical protein
MAELEAAQDKKSKKKIECVACLKKDADLQALQQRITKLAQDSTDQDKLRKSKDQQIRDQ